MNFLVTAVGSLSAESVIASLNSIKGSRVIGCNTFPQNWTAASLGTRSFYQVPPAVNVDDYVSSISEICRSEEIEFLIALTDPEVDALCNTISKFRSFGTILCLPDKSGVEISRDKFLLRERFKDDVALTTIPTVLLTNVDPLSSLFPLIAKPRRGRSSEGLFKVENNTDLHYLLTSRKQSDYVVQPFIQGQVCVVDVVRHRNSGDVACLCRKELVRSANGAGLTVEMFFDARLRDAAVHAAESLELNGCVNMEFILSGGEFHLMDLNPRFSAGVGFSKLAGYDMVINHVHCFDGSNIDDSIEPRRAVYTRRSIEIEVIDRLST